MNIYSAVGLKFFELAEANMDFERICGPIGSLVCLFTNFGANTNVSPFADAACKEFSAFMRNTAMDVQEDFTQVIA